jgi:predicted DNA-binding protein
MAVIRISDENKAKLDALLAKKIGETKNPSLTMDEVITALLFIAEVQTQ